jgi:anti-sigma factor RsiW
MTEPPTPHLTDETLNEYLDDALDGGARSTAAAHLAGCAACAGRLDALRALFTGLETLPEAPLERSLTPGVMAYVRGSQRFVPAARLRTIADPSRPAFRLIFAVQTGLALALLAFAWPFVISQALPLPPVVAGDLAGLAAGWASGWPSPAGLWAAVQAWAATAQPALPRLTVLQPLAAGLLLILAGACWLVGNALLLRRSPTPRPEKNL